MRTIRPLSCEDGLCISVVRYILLKVYVLCHRTLSICCMMLMRLEANNWMLERITRSCHPIKQ